MKIQQGVGHVTHENVEMLRVVFVENISDLVKIEPLNDLFSFIVTITQDDSLHCGENLILLFLRKCLEVDFWNLFNSELLDEGVKLIRLHVLDPLFVGVLLIKSFFEVSPHDSQSFSLKEVTKFSSLMFGVSSF